MTLTFLTDAAATRRATRRSARDSVYVEYDDGTREYHDYATDPYELRNSFPTLSPNTKASLHAAVNALRICHGAQACWNAARPSRR